MKKYHYIFIDFNGTLLDDVNLCLESLNYLLKYNKQPTVDYNTYKHIFTFPIIEYYKAAGFDFSRNSYEELAKMFINYYQKRSLNCELYNGVITTLKQLKKDGYNLILLSASQKDNLLEQVKHFNLLSLFDNILGIDTIYAESKVDIALNYLNKNNINPLECLIIGDTLHDLEVANTLNTDCVLVSCGHQHIDILKKHPKVINSLADIYKVL